MAEDSNKRSWSRRLLRTVQVFLLGALFIIGLSVIILFFTGDISGPLLYRFPGDYRGWAGVRYNDPGCSPLRKEGWYLVLKFDASGRACTSSSVPGGWRYERYEYVYADGRRKKLSGIHNDIWPVGVSGSQAPQIETLFVGSEAELKKAWPRRQDFRREMEQKR
jgi:hypothetical protein